MAIDDFGTGFASVDIMQKMPADIIKIDREFVRGIETDEKKRHAVHHLCAMAAIYAPGVCVEGVETTGMRDILRQGKVQTFQGYLYSKPLPLNEFLAKQWA